MKKLETLLLITALLLTACNNKKTESATHSFYTVDYEAAVKNETLVKLSEIAKSVRYIPIQTDTTCLLERSQGFMFTPDNILFQNRDQILAFDYNGRYIRNIGTPGKGPHEINMMVNVSLLNKEKLIVIKTLGNNQMLYFDYNGKFVKSMDAHTFMSYAIQNDTVLDYDLCCVGYEDYFFRLTNKNNDTISVVSNPFKWTNNTGTIFMITFSEFNPFYRYKDQYFFKSMHNDTVYTINSGKIVPSYLINLGKYQLPIEMRPENPASKEKFDRVNKQYYYASSIESSGKLFITSSNYMGNDNRHIVYDIDKSKGTFLVNDSSKASGFINDWDNGPDFWPQGYVNDNTLFMGVSAAKLKTLIESDAFLNAKGNDKNRKALIDMAAKLNEEDNPVVMIVELK
jgi:hypothetical protein